MKATEHKRLVVGLCDDEEYVCDSVYKILKKYGNEHQIEIEFIYYNSAKLLLEKRDMLDVLFLDIEMPKMDGIQLLQEIRNNELVEGLEYRLQDYYAYCKRRSLS